MAEFTYNSDLWLAHPRQKLFKFFSDASNLQALTPEWLFFSILTPCPVIQKGARIDYLLRIRGIPIEWQTEITAWEPPHRFVDEQQRGPYRKWVHEHLFIEERGGTRMKDHVQYEVPGGRLTHWLFVKRDVEKIFAFRRAKLLELFPEEPNRPQPDP